MGGLPALVLGHITAHGGGSSINFMVFIIAYLSTTFVYFTCCVGFHRKYRNVEIQTKDVAPPQVTSHAKTMKTYAKMGPGEIPDDLVPKRRLLPVATATPIEAISELIQRVETQS